MLADGETPNVRRGWSPAACNRPLDSQQEYMERQRDRDGNNRSENVPSIPLSLEDRPRGQQFLIVFLFNVNRLDLVV